LTPDPVTEDLWRELAPQVLGTLVRRYGRFDACEDAVQEALIAASRQWPVDGVPDRPRSWLVTVASRRLVDEWRSDSARRRREESDALLEAAGAGQPHDQDDTLTLLFMCCDPSLTAPSQLALTLRAVGGLTTAEVAAAFLVPEATMAQRISRAKQSLRKAGVRFVPPADDDRADRLRVVTQVIYLIFNEGYLASSGRSPMRTDLTREAVRLARLLHALEPDEPEVAGLLALLLLIDARRDARTTSEGALVPLAEQDRSRWDRRLVDEGTRLLEDTLGRGLPGPYQLQAAIAALHDEASRDETTDWLQILALYRVLERLAPGPVVTLNRAVAVARVDGPRAGLAVLDALEEDERMARSHRLDAVRGHLLESAGEREAARAAYGRAARATASPAERDYLLLRAAQLR
jgi:RNA polymerase sigma factor (sigma-70 family)